MNDSTLLALQVLVPSLAAGALLLAGRRARASAGMIAAAVLAGDLGGAVWALSAAPAGRWTWVEADGASLVLSLSAEGVAGIFAVVVAATALAVVVYSIFYIERDDARGRFFGFMLLFGGAMLALVLAADLLTLLLAWELVGLCSYALIGFWYQEPARARDAARAFLVTRAADLGLYVAAMAAWAGGSLALAALPALPSALRDVVVLGLVVAAVGKSAQLPLSGWLPGAMSGPTPVSALLHSATMVAAGAILLIKVLPLLGAVPWAAESVLWIGVATALAGALIALAQDDLKQLLAASTISQYGYMFAAIGAAGGAAATAYLANHAAFKALLFLGAGVLIRLQLHRLSEMGGLRGSLPLLSVLFLIGALALAAVPPMGGYFAKEEVIGAVHEHSTVAFWALMVAAFLTAWYAGRVWLGAFGGSTKSIASPAGERGLLTPMAVLAVAALVGGILVVPPVASWLEETITVGNPLPPAHGWMAAVSITVVVAGIATAWLTQGRRLNVLAADRWLFLPNLLDMAGTAVISGANRLHRLLAWDAPADLGHRSVAAAGRLWRPSAQLRLPQHAGRVGVALARLVDTTERRLVAPTMHWGGTAAWRSAGGVMVFDHRALAGATSQLTAALSRSAGGLCRLQSGLLHRYYAGVAVGVGALVGYAVLLILV